MLDRKLLGRICLGVILSVSAAYGEARCCRSARTDFGYLQVDRADVAVATKVGSEVRGAAQDVLGIVNARFLIVDSRHSRYRWGDSTPSGLPVYPWSFAHGTVDLRVKPPDEILPHEIGHDLFRRYLIPSTRAGQYGTDAPDWLDESVAVAFEAPEQKAQRRCEASRLLGSGALIPIDRYLTMSHPDLAATPRAPNADRAGTFNLSSSVSAETPAFYAMSIAFYEYLVARTGSPSILAELARPSHDRQSIEQRLIARTADGRPRYGLEQMNEDFLHWLASDKRYQCSAGM
jgi:hypothetical protein